MHLEYEWNFAGKVDFIELNDSRAAVVSEVTSPDVYSTTTAKPIPVSGVTNRGYVPWGEENDMPAQIVKKVQASDVMNPNMYFNVLCGYGRGLEVTPESGLMADDQKLFFRRNRAPLFIWETQTDLKHWFFAICVLLVSRDGKKVTRLVHKEADSCRFETCNPNNGKIEKVFFANWEDNPDRRDIESVVLLDYNDPWYDLMVQLGREPDDKTGIKKDSGIRKFAYLIKIPTARKKYYPFATYQSNFLSGWYDTAAMVPKAKNAKMKNGMSIRYHVEIHRDYWTVLFSAEQITDPEKQLARKKKEFNNIKEFLSGIDNQDKVWWSGYYVDPNGKEQRMVRIHVIDSKKEGGDWIEDAEEAANFQCYAQGVHPSLNGATPGKSKGSMSGSDARERYTMKQALEKPVRDLILEVYYLINDVNGWPETKYEIGDLMLTTLDKGTDAAPAKPIESPKMEE